MKRAVSFLVNPFLDPRAVIFGVAIFTFGWVWVSSSKWEFHKYIFMAALLLVSSVLIIIKRVWSNILAAAFSGYLPVQLAYEFWMFAKSEVPIFSFRHFAFFAGILDVVEGAVIFFFALTAMILACSVHTMKCLATRRETSNDA
jgi:hypothetical protein